jgi:hypothetical protein
MTTRVTVQTTPHHAARVTLIDLPSGAEHVHVVAPGVTFDFHVHDTRSLRIDELPRAAAAAAA